MLEMTIDTICVIPGDHHRVVILKEKAGDLYLSILMCPAEAQVIVLKLQGVGTTRPSTHDLLGTVIPRNTTTALLTEVRLALLP